MMYMMSTYDMLISDCTYSYNTKVSSKRGSVISCALPTLELSNVIVLAIEILHGNSLVFVENLFSYNVMSNFLIDSYTAHVDCRFLYFFG